MYDKQSPFAPRPERGDSLAKAVLTTLHAASVSCQIPPGSAVSKAELARRFGFGLAPVRAAVMHLSAAGWTAPDGRRGSVILAVSAEHLADLAASRACLQPSFTQTPPQRADLWLERAFGLARASLPLADLAAALADAERLVADLVNEPTTLDPHLQWNPDSYYVYCNIFDNLLTRDDQGAIVPQIATKWDQVSETETIFTIRDDVRFHNGSPLTAEDVILSVQRITDPEFGSPQLSQLEAIIAAEVLEDGRVKLNLTAACPGQHRPPGKGMSTGWGEGVHPSLQRVTIARQPYPGMICGVAAALARRTPCRWLMLTDGAAEGVPR